MKWYRFIFADGHEIFARGLDRVERAAAERAHGKLVSKKPA